MTITIEEVKRVADTVGTLRFENYSEINFTDAQFQAFAQHYIEEGRKMQREKDATLCEEYKVPDKIEGAHPDYIDGKRMAKDFCEKYLSLCQEYKAEVVINSHGVHCVYTDDGQELPFSTLCPEWDEEVTGE